MEYDLTDNQSSQLRIAAIISPSEIIMNAGVNRNVRNGAQYAILDSRGVRIKDPETGKVIGRIPSYKYLLEVITVMPLFSILQTVEIPNNQTLMNLGKMRQLMLQSPVMHVKDPTQILNFESRYTEAPIEIGDRLVRISHTRRLS